MPENQKSIEQTHIQRLKEIYPSFPEGIPNLDSEEHDCLITKSDGQIIGIEHTCLFRLPNSPKEKPPKQIESMHEIIISGAKRLYEEKNHPPVDVVVIFSDFLKIDRNKKVGLQNTLAKLIPNLLPAPNTSEHYECTGLNDSPIPPEFNYIRIARFDVLDENRWSPIGAAYVPNIEEGRIISEIGKKEAKLAAYRRKADKVWLLIVMDGFELSSTFGNTERLESVPFKTSFDKVIIFRNFEKKFIELKTYQPTD